MLGGTGGRSCPACQPRQRTGSGQGEAGPGKGAQHVPGRQGERAEGAAGSGPGRLSATRWSAGFSFSCSALGGKEQGGVGKITNLFIKTGWH